MTDVRADRHIVAGGRGTAVISARAVAIIDAPPASAPAVAWENLLFGPDAADSPVDPFASIVDDDLTSFARNRFDRLPGLLAGRDPAVLGEHADDDVVR